MSEMKPTKGEAFSKRDGFSTVYVEVRIGGGWLQEVAACGPTANGQDEQQANADLITETFNVHNTTGLTPSQLGEMVKELKAASKHCEDLLTSYEINRVNGEELADTALAMLRAALAKCEGVKP